MDDETTRQPRSPEDYATMIMQQLGANTMADAWSKVATLTTHKPLVVMDAEGRLYIAPMKVKEVSILITTLENMDIK